MHRVSPDLITLNTKSNIQYLKVYFVITFIMILFFVFLYTGQYIY